MILAAALVVVELFTSQGCSSCPPAEALISKLDRARAIPLAYHVDYWDNLGWRDPFSSRDWTARQMMYVRGFALNGAYTPQAVVNGTRQFVGSNASALKRAIDEAKDTGSLTLDATRKGSKIEGSVRADVPRNSDVVVVLFEDGVTTHIARGENEGRTATEDAIVRRLVRTNGAFSFETDPSWKRLGVVAFVQDRTTLAITAATNVILTPRSGGRISIHDDVGLRPFAVFAAQGDAVSLVDFAVLHNVNDVAQRGHVSERIAVDDDDVREFSRCQRAEVRLLEKLGGPVSCGPDGVHRRHAEVDHCFELAPGRTEMKVERDSGVSADDDRHAGFAKLTEFVRERRQASRHEPEVIEVRDVLDRIVYVFVHLRRQIVLQSLIVDAFRKSQRVVVEK